MFDLGEFEKSDVSKTSLIYEPLKISSEWRGVGGSLLSKEGRIEEGRKHMMDR